MFLGHFHRITSHESWTCRKLIFVVAKTELSTRLNSSLFHMRNHCRNRSVQQMIVSWTLDILTLIESFSGQQQKLSKCILDIIILNLIKSIRHFSWKYSHRPLRPHSLLIVSNSCSKWIKSIHFNKLNSPTFIHFRSTRNSFNEGENNRRTTAIKLHTLSARQIYWVDACSVTIAFSHCLVCSRRNREKLWECTQRNRFWTRSQLIWIILKSTFYSNVNILEHKIMSIFHFWWTYFSRKVLNWNTIQK